MSYDMIDRFLRNNLGDDDYAEYLLALDQVASPPQRPWVGLPMDEFKFIASKYLLSREVGLEYFQEEIEAKLKELNT